MKYQPDHSDIRGLVDTVVSLSEALLSGRRVLLIGGAGCRALSLANRAPGLFGPLLPREQMELMTIYGRARMEAPGLRPFRAPHYSVTYCGMGGMKKRFMDKDDNPRFRYIPGELELAKHGVLMLDEVTEFPRRVTDLVGTRLRTGTALVAAACSCPCGRFGVDGRKQTKAPPIDKPQTTCNCTPEQLERWNKRIDGACSSLRIDTRITVPLQSGKQRRDDHYCPSTEELRASFNQHHNNGETQ